MPSLVAILDRMNYSRIAVVAAITCLVAWTAKAIAIGLAGGLDRSALESPLFVVGFVASLVAGVAAALARTASRHPVARVGAVVLVLAAVYLVILGVNLVLEQTVTGDAWVWSEVNLWVVALLLLGITLAGRRPLKTA